MRSSLIDSVEKQGCWWFSLALHSNVSANALWSERNNLVSCIFDASCRTTHLNCISQVYIKCTHTDSWLWHGKYCQFPIISHPGSSSTSAAEKNRIAFCVPWSRMKTNQTKKPTKPTSTWGGVYIASVSMLHKAYLRQWKLTDQTEALGALVTPKRELINESAFKTQWSLCIDSHASDIISLWFCSFSAKQHTWSAEKKPAVNTFFCVEEKPLALKWQMKYSCVGSKYFLVSILQT